MLRTEEELHSDMAKATSDIAGTTYRLLIRIGDKLADREAYSHHKGMDAVHFYLTNKYHWPLAQVRSMTLEDLWFCICEDEPK
jgi:hypothetical protein